MYRLILFRMRSRHSLVYGVYTRLVGVWECKTERLEGTEQKCTSMFLALESQSYLGSVFYPYILGVSTHSSWVSVDDPS